MKPLPYVVTDATGCVPQFRAGYSSNPATEAAAAELRELLDYEQATLVLVFASNRYERKGLAQALRREFGSVPVIGCTTAGEIGPLGYMEGGIVGLALGSSELVYEAGLLEQVSHLNAREGQGFAYRLRQRLAQRAEEFDPARCFALLLVDGLCGHEEPVARAVQVGLGGIQMIGGSAADGLDFRQTAVLYDGRFHSDAAVLLVAATPYRYVTFKTQHFVSGSRRLVLTAVIPSRRIVTEINGCPAAAEYARAIGVVPEELGPAVFSAHPFAIRIGGADFVRTVLRANDDGSLTFFCAIDEGLVFNLAERVDFVQNLRTLFDEIEERIGPPRLVVGCDCIMRRLELIQRGSTATVSALLRKYNVVGFSSYGEQFRGIHVNQTFTGIAFSGRRFPA